MSAYLDSNGLSYLLGKLKDLFVKKTDAATAAPGKVASASAQGSSTNYARQDHTHGIDLATGDANGQVKIAGTNVSVKGLGAMAYKGSLAASDIPAATTSAKGGVIVGNGLTVSSGTIAVDPVTDTEIDDILASASA